MKWHWISRQGGKGANQDAVAVPPPRSQPTIGVFAVVDGITRCPLGGAVARLCAREIERWRFTKPGEIESALDANVLDIWRHYDTQCRDDDESGDDWRASGCSLSIAVVAPSAIHIRHIGDTAVDWQPGGEPMTRVTEKQSYPDGSLIYWFGGDAPPQWQSVVLPHSGTGHLLMTSDGVSGHLNANGLAGIGESWDWNFDDFAPDAIDTAHARGSRDDSTLLYVSL